MCNLATVHADIFMTDARAALLGARPLAPGRRCDHPSNMIVTHTTNPEGHRRVYLGGKSSLECWIEPLADGISWSFHLETAPGRYPLRDDQRRAWAAHTLMALAEELAVSPEELTTIAFERIAALHTASPLEYRRIAVPRRQRMEHGFMAEPPRVTSPSPQFRRAGGARRQR